MLNALKVTTRGLPDGEDAPALCSLEGVCPMHGRAHAFPGPLTSEMPLPICGWCSAPAVVERDGDTWTISCQADVTHAVQVTLQC